MLEPQPSIAELAYLAGVIDSDGHLAVTRRRNRTGKGFVYAEALVIKQATPEACELAQRIFGGGFYLRQPTPASKGRRPMWTWVINGARAYRAIQWLLPYLRIKIDQAAAALRLRELLDTSHRRRWVVPEIKDDDTFMTASQFAIAVGAHRESIFLACKNGSLPSIKRGHNRLVPVSALDGYRIEQRARYERTWRTSPARSVDVMAQMEAIYQHVKSLHL